MRRSNSRSSSLVFPAASSADFSSQRCMLYTDKQAPLPLLITAPRSIWIRNLAGTARRPLASIVCSYSPRNMFLHGTRISEALLHQYACHTLQKRVVPVAPEKHSSMFSRIQEFFTFFPTHRPTPSILPHFSPLSILP